MSKNRNAKPSPKPPSSDNPPRPEDLPPEVTNPNAAKSPLLRAREMEETEILRIFRTELGGAGFITFQRRHPPSGQTQFSHVGGSMPIDGFSIQNVSQVYGGGDFIARARTSDGQFSQEVRFSIDHSIAPKNPMSQAVEKKEAPPAVDLPALVREISHAMPKQQNETGLVEIVKAALARPEPKGEIAALAELIKETRDEARKSEERFMKLFERLTDRQAPAEKPRTLLEQLEEARELIDAIGGNGGGKEESWWREIGKGAAEALGPLIKNHFAGAAPTNGAPQLAARSPIVTAAPASLPSPAPAAAAAAVIPETPAAAETPADMTPALNFALNRFRTAAVDAARRQKDSFEWVESMIGFVPEQYLGSIFQKANSETWFADIFGADQDALKHVTWLSDMRNCVLLKSFLAHAARSFGEKKTPADTVKTFIGWASPDFREPLLATTDSAPSEWAALFDPSISDEVWLEQLRQAVVAELGDEDKEEEAKPAAALAGKGEPTSEKKNAQ